MVLGTVNKSPESNQNEQGQENKGFQETGALPPPPNPGNDRFPDVADHTEKITVMVPEHGNEFMEVNKTGAIISSRINGREF